MANRKRHAIDTATAERWKLLGRLLRARRMELGYMFRPAFAEARLPRTAQGNLSVRLLNAIENGERPGTYAPGRLEQFARAYEVTLKSVHAVLEGKADELAPAAPPAVPGEPPGWAQIADPGRRDSARPWADRIWERLRQLAGRGVMEPSGEEVFGRAPGDPPGYSGAGSAADARDWDDAGSRLPLPERVWFLADLQRRDAGRRGSDREGHSAGA